ncbi:MAG: dimethylsulfonioproprionate lyase family protein [Hyphomicrobiaceae bacterium]
MTNAEDGAPCDTPAAPETHLSEAPDWLYLLRELYDMYWRSSAGGSKRIRSHQRTVRERISRVIENDPLLSAREHVTKPVCAHLKRALDQGRLQRTATVIRAIESISGELAWMYGYERLPKHLTTKFAYAEIAGPTGPVQADNIILGLVLFAPRCVYPAHSHDGITESYFCLSGAVSENDDGVYAPGSLIFNPPGRNHRITVGDREPCLLAYAWAGAVDKLADQKLVFTRNRAAPRTG